MFRIFLKTSDSCYAMRVRSKTGREMKCNMRLKWRSDEADLEMITTWTPAVGKTMPQNLQEEFKWPLSSFLNISKNRLNGHYLTHFGIQVGKKAAKADANPLDPRSYVKSDTCEAAWQPYVYIHIHIYLYMRGLIYMYI